MAYFSGRSGPGRTEGPRSAGRRGRLARKVAYGRPLALSTTPARSLAAVADRRLKKDERDTELAASVGRAIGPRNSLKRLGPGYSDCRQTEVYGHLRKGYLDA
jgi:anion-transporting  ArsA/GET3 family ATPase